MFTLLQQSSNVPHGLTHVICMKFVFSQEAAEEVAGTLGYFPRDLVRPRLVDGPQKTSRTGLL